MISTKVRRGYGHFGSLVKNYAQARKGFPQKAINYLFRLVGKRRPSILDLGCGTGISTRQIAERNAIVIGADKDKKMLRVATREDRKNISYLTAFAEQLPFKDGSFDAVTAFSAFHWFANKKALSEIKRVLKPSGVIFIVNKDNIGSFKKSYRSVFQKFIGYKPPDAKKKYNVPVILKCNGFRSVKTMIFKLSEHYTLPQALSRFQSMSLWNLIPKNRRGLALKKFGELIIKRSRHGVEERKIEIRCVVGKK